MIQHGLIGVIRRAATGPVKRVTIHHEGAGVPTDFARGAEGGYSVWIGADTWTPLRSPYVSYGTLGFNHVSVDICLSGNREVCYVGERDVANIGAACADYRKRGWLADDVTVVAHKFSPGSNTVCPGTETFRVFSRIVAACHGINPLPPTQPQLKDDEMFVVYDEIHPGITPEHPRVCAIDPSQNGVILLGNGANIGTGFRIWNGLFAVDPGYVPGEKYVGTFPRRDEHGRCKGFTMMSILPNGQWGTRNYWFAK